MTDFILSWEGTNYSIFDDGSLVLMLNLNNNSDLGENDSFGSCLFYCSEIYLEEEVNLFLGNFKTFLKGLEILSLYHNNIYN